MNFEKIISIMSELFEKLEAMEPIDRLQAKKMLPKKGVYVFYEKEMPVYVGRSKNIPSRVLNHGRPSSGHNSATFAFLLAKEEYDRLQKKDKKTRGNLEKDPVFKNIYQEKKKRVANMKIKAVEVDSNETEAIYLNSQLSAMAFYAHFGFEETGGIFYEASIPHRKMVLKTIRSI